MPLTTLDDRTALVVIDLQRGLAGATTAPHGMTDVIGRTAALADAFRAHDRRRHR
jgi:nicotinamidase-related amidase